MLGCIVAGKLVNTNPRQVDTTKYVFDLPDAANINHIVVFLLGTQPFQPGYAATVHLLWPNKEWQLLGMISNEKPSAIFRLKSTNINDTSANNPNAADIVELGISIEPIEMVQQTITESKAKSGIANNNGGVGQSGASSSSQMLVPIKPGNINEMVPQLAQQWSQNALTNLREFVISYSKPYSSQLPASTAANLNQLLQQLQAAVPPDQLQPLTAILQGEVIPTKVFDEWYEQFIRKIKMNPTWGLKLNN